MLSRDRGRRTTSPLRRFARRRDLAGVYGRDRKALLELLADADTTEQEQLIEARIELAQRLRWTRSQPSSPDVQRQARFATVLGDRHLDRRRRRRRRARRRRLDGRRGARRRRPTSSQAIGRRRPDQPRGAACRSRCSSAAIGAGWLARPPAAAGGASRRSTATSAAPVRLLRRRARSPPCGRRRPGRTSCRGSRRRGAGRDAAVGIALVGVVDEPARGADPELLGLGPAHGARQVMRWRPRGDEATEPATPRPAATSSCSCGAAAGTRDRRRSRC